MKNFIVFMIMICSVQVLAKVEEVAVCGQYKTLGNTKLFLVRKGNLERGQYEIFASNPRSAQKLASMKNRKSYCIRGLFDSDRANDGISLIQIVKAL